MDHKDLMKLVYLQQDNGIKYHVCKTNTLPNRIQISDFERSDWKAFKRYVEENFDWSEHNRFRLSSINGDDINYFLYLDCSISISFCYSDSVNMIFDPNSDSEALRVLKSKFEQLNQLKKNAANRCYQKPGRWT